LCDNLKSIHMKLSVAMITYNHERFIGQAIESVLAQKVNFEYEIVVGEDCSTDGTRAIVTDLSRRYPSRIVPLLRERNLGGPRNFHGTLAACRGQYVALLEGDDYWTCTNKLQKQVDFLDLHPDWNICCSRAQVRNELNVSSGALRVQTGAIFPARPDSPPVNGQDLAGLLPVSPRAAGTYTLKDLLCENFIPTCTVVYRWSGLPRFPSSLSRSALGDLTRHAIVAGQKNIELLDDCTAVYRIHPGGIWSSRDRVSQFIENTTMLAALNRHLGHPYKNLLGAHVARSYLYLSLAARQEGKRVEACKHVLSCLRNGGWQSPGSRRLLAGLAAYALIGSWYKVFSRVKSSDGG
jgi:glycosyltransferase involved in cell wall biosynthesis